MGKKILVTLVTPLVLFSITASIVPVVGRCVTDVEVLDIESNAVEVEKKVWDADNEKWAEEIYANVSEVIRFNISITYYDVDGDGPGYMVKSITVVDTLPSGLEYAYNATMGETSISSDGQIVMWNLTGVELYDGQSVSLEFDANVTSYGTHVNTVNVSAFETCSHVWYYTQANAIVYVRSTNDTEPPTVEITKPKENWLYRNNIRIRPLSGKTKIIGYIRIKVNAEDASGIEKVEFYIDDQLEYTDTSSKYSWIWLPRSKEDHTIKVIAYDIAGNDNSSELTVSIGRSHPLLAIGAIGGSALLISRLVKLRSEEETEPPIEEPEEEPEEEPVEEPEEEPEAELEGELEEEDYIFWYIVGGLSVILAMLLVGLFIGGKFYV
jgi:hypothetical protein